MKLSVVTTLYCSSPFLAEFHRRIKSEAEKITSDYEIILVNDGSPDDSLNVATSLLEEDSSIVIIDLSRNFGHHKAMMTGLQHSTGDIVFSIDCDLEEQPEVLSECFRRMKTEEADVVYGVQDHRHGSWFRRVSGWLFYKIFNLLSSHSIPPNTTMARLMTRRYIDSLIQHQDREVFLAGLWAVTGFKQIPVVITKSHKNHSTYTLKRRMSLLVDAITSFSGKPLVMIFYLGLLIMICSATGAAYLVLRKLFFDEYLTGWTSLIVSIWFLGGLIIFCLGIIGIYVSKVFSETKKRPYTIVKGIYTRASRQ